MQHPEERENVQHGVYNTSEEEMKEKALLISTSSLHLHICRFLQPLTALEFACSDAIQKKKSRVKLSVKTISMLSFFLLQD